MRIGVRYSTDWSLIEGRCRPDAAIPRTYVQGSVRAVCLLMGTGAWSTTIPLSNYLECCAMRSSSCCCCCHCRCLANGDEDDDRAEEVFTLCDGFLADVAAAAIVDEGDTPADGAGLRSRPVAACKTAILLAVNCCAWDIALIFATSFARRSLCC